MASISLQLPPLGLGCACTKSFSSKLQNGRRKLHGMNMQCFSSKFRTNASNPTEFEEELSLTTRRDVIGFIFGASSLSLWQSHADAAGLPQEEQPKLCDKECEKELENLPMITTESGLQYKDIKVGGGPSPPVGFQHYEDKDHVFMFPDFVIDVVKITDKVAANCVAMVPSGKIFDSSLEKGQLYIFRVGAGQVIKGLDEGILSMKVGGKRRLYIPGSLAFPKGLTSAPGRPRVAPNSPVIFDVSLEYIPGLELDIDEE